MDLVQAGTGGGEQVRVTTRVEPGYRMTCQVPLIGLETFCHSLQAALTERNPPADIPAIWRLYVSADCPRCGIPVCGEELLALAAAPCAELASPKTGRVRAWGRSTRRCRA